jgi:hypothetical protein
VSMDFYPSLHVLLLGSADVFVRSQYPPSVCSSCVFYFFQLRNSMAGAVYNKYKDTILVSLASSSPLSFCSSFQPKTKRIWCRVGFRVDMLLVFRLIVSPFSPL